MAQRIFDGPSVLAANGLTLMFMIVGSKAQKVARFANHVQWVSSCDICYHVSVGPGYQLTCNRYSLW